MILNTIWFVLIGVLLAGYAVLDGFDLGAAILLPFVAKNDRERNAILQAIGPIWDGNEVWLLTGGGALFAAFPQAYATVFSGFYLALMLVLFALIFRAAATEFRVHDAARRRFWEGAFVVGSLLPALLYGVAIGNVVLGVPLNAQMEYTGDFFTLLRPYPLALGLLGLAMFVMQGAAFLTLKTNGELQNRARAWWWRAWLAVAVLFAASFVLAVILMPERLGLVLAWLAALVVTLGIVWAGWAIRKQRDGLAGVATSLITVALMGLVGAVNYPNLVTASNDPQLSLTIYNAASSPLTLTVMLIIALVGMPIVIGYTAYIYWIFRGKIRAEAGEEYGY